MVKSRRVRCGSVVFRLPSPLRSGSLIAVVAPAGPFERAYLLPGLAWLRTRYRLRLTSSIHTRTGYLAGDDSRRAAELARAMEDREVEAILCARGGYGALRILDALPWDAFAARPKWIAGFSDITALHVEANRRGVCTLHSPNVTGLGHSTTAAERGAVIDALEGRPRAGWSGLEIVHPGPTATGPMVGGNLALLVTMAAAGRLVVPHGAILAFEDITERPYRLDRMITSLRVGGHLARASAIVLGGFTECDPGPDGVTAADVLRERTADLGVPVVSGAPFGHGAVNRSFVVGGTARLDGGALQFVDEPSGS